jgi:hypothetical protein
MDGTLRPAGIPRGRALRVLAAGSLALVLIVVVASAAIRQSGGELGAWLAIVRGAHRVSASVAALLIAGLAWVTWRAGRRALAGAIVAVTAALSIVGAATGTAPPPLAQAANLLGGLLLAALLAHLLGTGAAPRRLLWVVAVQALLGAWIAIFAADLWSWPLALHALLGLLLAVALAYTRRAALAILALATVAAGATAVLFELPLGATLAHAAAAALLVIAVAYTAIDAHQGSRPG